MKLSTLRDRWHTLDRNQIRAAQAAQLHRFLEGVILPFSSNYRKIFDQLKLGADDFRSLEDLQRIPFTSKADLLPTEAHPQRARDFVVVPDPAILKKRPNVMWHALLHGKASAQGKLEKEFRPIFMTSTTGRSADPVPFFYSSYDIDNLTNAGHRLFAVCGGERDYRVLNLFPYAPHLAFWQTHYGAISYGVFELSTGGGKVMSTDMTLRMIQKIQPDIIVGMPTFLYHILHQAAGEKIAYGKLKRVVLGGEKAPDGMRRKLRGLAQSIGSPNIQVVGTYGFTEAKMAWGECPGTVDGQSTGYHLYPDLGIFEVIDPVSGETLGDHQPGELVFTPIDSRGSVVLRYRTGDYIDGGLTYEPCPACNRRCPRLIGQISRSSEIKSMQLDKLKGTLVDFNQLEHVLDDAATVGAWQLEMRKVHDDPMELDELILHLHAVDGVPPERVKKEVLDRFLSRTEISPNRVIFHTVDEMRQLQGVGVQIKEQKIVDHRPRVSTT